MKRLSYNGKCYILFGGFVIFLIVGYKFSFSETIKNYSEISEKESKIEWLVQKENELPVIREKMAKISRKLTGEEKCIYRGDVFTKK